MSLSMSEIKVGNLNLVKVFGMPLHVFSFVLFAALLIHFTDTIPLGAVGAFAFMYAFGIIFGEIGDRLPVWKEYIGGAPVLIFIASAFFVYKSWFTEREINTITSFMKDTKFLNLYIAVLMTGSIFAVNRKLLVKALVGYIPVILVGVVAACGMGILGGFVFGVSLKDIIMLYVLPTMGGGNGAGAVPMSEIYHAATGNPKEAYYSYAIAVLTIANIWAIIISALLNKIGRVKPIWTGNGVLVRKGKLVIENDPEVQITSRDIAVGFMMAVSSYTLGYFLYKNVYNGIHYYAYMVIILAVLNGTGFIPIAIKQGAGKMQQFFTKQFTWVLMVGVGVAYTDLHEIIQALTFENVIIALMIVVGATIGSGVAGYLVGFYPIEASITAGLCMANRGGSGDIEVLGAAKRMNLISYAQISSRLGGGIVLIIASLLFKILAGS
jgi:CCS family citrate carrier protein